MVSGVTSRGDGRDTGGMPLPQTGSSFKPTANSELYCSDQLMNKILFTCLVPFFALAILAGGCCSYCSSKGSRTVELFDGKSLDGWNYVLADSTVKKEDVWSVQ